MVEKITRDASAWGSRAAPLPQTIATALEKLQPAPQKSGIDRATTRPTVEGLRVPLS